MTTVYVLEIQPVGAPEPMIVEYAGKDLWEAVVKMVRDYPGAKVIKRHGNYPAAHEGTA